MATIAFYIIQKNNTYGLRNYYINNPGLLTVPKEYIQTDNCRLYLGPTFLNEDTDTPDDKKFLLTNSIQYYLENRENDPKVRYIPYYCTSSNIKRNVSSDYKEEDVVLDGMYSIPIVSRLNKYNDIFEELSTKYSNIYVDCSYLNYLATSIEYNKNPNTSDKVTFITDNAKVHEFNYRNIFVLDLDDIDENVNLSFLKFVFFGMHLDYINAVWHNTSILTDNIMKSYFALLNVNEYVVDGHFTKCRVDLVSLAPKILYLENVSYEIMRDIPADRFASCNNVNDFKTVLNI